MSAPLVKWSDANLPPADVKRLAELEALAKEHGRRFYTLEICPSSMIAMSYHSDKIFTRRIKGDDRVSFEVVLDEALRELKAHILAGLKK